MNASTLILQPKQPLIDWVNAQIKSDDLPVITLETYDQEDGPTVYLIPDFEEVSQAQRWLKKHYRPIFEEVLSTWIVDENDWPEDLSYDTFKKWFKPDFNLMVLDLRLCR